MSFITFHGNNIKFRGLIISLWLMHRRRHRRALYRNEHSQSVRDHLLADQAFSRR